jgi:hypothetical protein
VKTTGTILKRKVGYASASGEPEINDINEEEQVRRKKRNKMDIDTIGAVTVTSESGA